jgi:hypothetical protein
VLLGPKQNPLVSKHNWELLSELWYVLVTAMPSEKNSVIRLVEKLVESVHKHFPTITINIEVCEPLTNASNVIFNYFEL